MGGLSTTANTVTLNAPAPAAGAVVTLTSNNPAATVPASVTVAGGTTVSPAFTIATSAVAANTPVTISATYGGITATGTLTVPAAQPIGPYLVFRVRPGRNVRHWKYRHTQRARTRSRRGRDTVEQ